MNKHRPLSNLRCFRQIAVFALLLGTLVACGGSSESPLEDLFASGAESAEGAVAGSNDDRPDWLNEWVQLPERVEIETAFNSESTGERLVTGLVRSPDIEAVTNEFHGLLVTSGFERLGESTYFVRDGEPAAQLVLRANGDTVLFTLEYDSNDVQTLREVYGTASATDAVGTESDSDVVPTESDAGVDGAQSVNTTLDLVIDDGRISQQGRCTFTSTRITFTNDNSEIVIEDPLGDSPIISGVMTQLATDDQEFQSWVVTPGGEGQSVSVTGTGFVANATFMNGIQFGGASAPASGVMAATC